jgi:hypothetical protein
MARLTRHTARSLGHEGWVRLPGTICARSYGVATGCRSWCLNVRRACNDHMSET